METTLFIQWFRAEVWILLNMEMQELMNNMAKPGRLDWISKRPIKRGPVEVYDSAEVSVQEGLVGDHYGGTSGNRQVTLIQAEHLEAVARILGVEEVDPTLTRRNLVVSGINLISLKEKRFHVGEVLLEGTGPCVPCSQMETNLGHGGYNAMRGHGGLCARVIKGGTIKIGDEVSMDSSPV